MTVTKQNQKSQKHLKQDDDTRGDAEWYNHDSFVRHCWGTAPGTSFGAISWPGRCDGG